MTLDGLIDPDSQLRESWLYSINQALVRVCEGMGVWTVGYSEIVWFQLLHITLFITLQCCHSKSDVKHSMASVKNRWMGSIYK